MKGYTLTTQSCHGNYYTLHSLREKGFWSGILVKMFSAIPGGEGREGGREREGEGGIGVNKQFFFFSLLFYSFILVFLPIILLSIPIILLSIPIITGRMSSRSGSRFVAFRCPHLF